MAKLRAKITGAVKPKLTFASKEDTVFPSGVAANGNNFELKVWWDKNKNAADPTGGDDHDTAYVSHNNVTKAANYAAGSHYAWLKGGWLADDGKRYLSLPKQIVQRVENKFVNPKRTIEVTTDTAQSKLKFNFAGDYVGFTSDDTVYVAGPIKFKNKLGSVLNMGTETIAAGETKSVAFIDPIIPNQPAGGLDYTWVNNSAAVISGSWEWPIDSDYSSNDSKVDQLKEFWRLRTHVHKLPTTGYPGKTNQKDIKELDVHDSEFTMHGIGDFAYYKSLNALRWKGSGNYLGCLTKKLHYTFAGCELLRKPSNLLMKLKVAPVSLIGVMSGTSLKLDRNAARSWDKPAGFKCTDFSKVTIIDYAFEYSSFDGTINYGSAGTVKSVVGMLQHTAYDTPLWAMKTKLSRTVCVTNMLKGNTAFDNNSLKGLKLQQAIGLQSMFDPQSTCPRPAAVTAAEDNPVTATGSRLHGLGDKCALTGAYRGATDSVYRPLFVTKNPRISIRPRSHSNDDVTIDVMWDSIWVDKTPTGFLAQSWADCSGGSKCLEHWNMHGKSSTPTYSEWNSSVGEHPLEVGKTWYVLKDSFYQEYPNKTLQEFMVSNTNSNGEVRLGANPHILSMRLLGDQQFTYLWSMKKFLKTKGISFALDRTQLTVGEFNQWVGDNPVHIMGICENVNAGLNCEGSADQNIKGSGMYYHHCGDFALTGLDSLVTTYNPQAPLN